MKYKYATILDLQKIENLLEIIKSDFLKTRKGKKGSLKRNLSNPKYRMILSIDKSKITGYISYIIKSKNKARLIGVGILKAYRRRGIGKNLVDKAIKDMKRMGARRIISRTWEKNYASQNLMKSFGFKKYRTVYNDRINGESTFWFKLKI